MILRTQPRLRHLVRRIQQNRWMQAGTLIALWAVCDRAVAAWHLPVPAGVVGFGLLLCLLGSGRVSADWLRGGAAGMLDHLVLFFIPAMLALVDHPELLGMLGLKLLGAVALGTLIVMVGTALTVELSLRWRRAHTHG